MSIVLTIAILSQAIPLSDPVTWKAGTDYPPTAIRNGDTGTVVYELAVDPKGEVIDCKIVQSSGSALLDEATCSSVRRNARFQPPTPGIAGSASYRGQIRWSLDENDVAKPVVLFARGLSSNLIGKKTIIGYEVAPEGGVRDCEVVSSSGNEKLDEFGCQVIAKKVRFKPPSTGLPMQYMSIEWRPSQ